MRSLAHALVLLGLVLVCAVAASAEPPPGDEPLRLGPEPLPATREAPPAPPRAGERRHRDRPPEATLRRARETAARKLERAGVHRFAKWLPRLSLLGRGGLSLVFEGRPQPTGFGDPGESGIVFQLAELEVRQHMGRFLTGGLDLLADAEGVVVEDAFFRLHDLPFGFGSRFGLFHTRAGFENERSRYEQVFVDQPLALGKLFGRFGHRVTGAEVSWSAPVPFVLLVHGSVMAASGSGSRSWYGDEAIELDSFHDMAWQLGLEGEWRSGSVLLGAELHGSFGPNPTGRVNRSDVWGAALRLRTRADDHEATHLRFETEWCLRRRQIPGDLLQDVAGWAWVGVFFGRALGLAARYDLTQGLEGDFVDPADTELRHRATLVASWSPLRFLRARLQGFADVGGPLGAPAYGTLLGIEAGYSTFGEGVVRKEGSR